MNLEIQSPSSLPSSRVGNCKKTVGHPPGFGHRMRVVPHLPDLKQQCVCSNIQMMSLGIPSSGGPAPLGANCNESTINVVIPTGALLEKYMADPC